MSRGHQLFLIVILFYSSYALATDRVSSGTGNWATAATWSPSGVPASGDNVTILSGHAIAMNSSTGTCNDITVNGTLGCNNATILNAGGNLVINNTGVINGGTGTLNVAGTFYVPTGASASIGSVRLSVAGTSTLDGKIIFNNTAGTKSFTNVTVNSGGEWNCSVAESLAISGNMTNNGTLISNTGTYTFSGSGKTFSGIVPISNVAVTGTYTNTATLTVGTALSGAGTLTQGVGATLNIGGTSAITNLVTTANPNTVNYKGSANQTIKVTPYYNLDVTSTGGTVTFGAITVNNNFTVATGTVSIGGVTMNVTSTTSISGTLTITSTTGTKRFNNLTINAGGRWNSRVAESFTINGNLSNSGTFTANTGTYTLAGTAKTISGTLTVPRLSVSGTYTNNATLTSSTALSGAGTFSQGSTGILNTGTTSANFSVAIFNASAPNNSVNYNRVGVQNVRVPNDGSYHHLTLAGSGNKTLLALTDVNGNLTINSVLAANNFNITLGGNWLCTGVFIPGTNTVTLDGLAQSITKLGGETFNHLTLSGSGTKTLGSSITANGNLTINSTLDVSSSNFGVSVKGNWVNNGAFIQRSGTVTFNGSAAQTIGGTRTTSFNNLTQNNPSGVSLAQAQNLIDSLAITAGIFTTTGFNFTLVSDVNKTARIAAIPSGANFAGNIIMQRYTGTSLTDWRLLSSPVAGATIADWADDFATSGFPGSTDPANSFVSIYSYNETVVGNKDSGYVAATNVTNSISSEGKGYFVYLGPGPITYSVSGPPNTFTITPTVTFTPSTPPDTDNDGWNLIANPYPSAIDWDNANWTKTNIDNAVYVYNAATSSYASYIPGDVPASINGGSGYIASQQAFWVKANAANPVIKLVEKVKTSQNPSLLKTSPGKNVSRYPMAFKDFPIPSNANTKPNSIKLTANGNGFDDETFIYFAQSASANFDTRFDAWKLQGFNPLSPNISSVINDSTDLSINGLPDLTSDVTIPIRVLVQSAGTYSIRRDSALMLPMSSCIILEDLVTKNFIDLRSNISYSFTIADTTSAPRFLLHVYAPVSKKAVKANCADSKNGMAIAKGTGTGPWNYIWKNSVGIVMQTTSNSLQADTLFDLPVGVYTIEVSGSVCGIISDTIEIKSSSALVLASGFSNVTCNGLNDGSAVVNVSGGKMPYHCIWSSGTTAFALHNLTAGNYSVVVTDAAACTQTQVFSISQPPVLIAGFTASADTVDLSTNNIVEFRDTSLGASIHYWDFGDTTLLDTSQNPSHYYSASGTYSVMLVASNGTCSDTSYGHILVIDSLITTGIKDLNPGSSVKVIYENGQVFLLFSLKQETKVNISVYNVLGEEIFSQNNLLVKSEKIKLNFPSTSIGVYIAVSEMKDAIISKKIFIPRRHFE